MTGTHPDGGLAIYGVPLGLWITVLIAVLSSAAAVFVAWRSNANSRKNLHEQLERSSEQFTAKLEQDAAQLAKQLSHDADQKDRERKMSLRREVYLEAASALVRLQTLLGKVSDLAYEQKTLLDDFGDAQAKLVKVHIVGSQTTVEAVMAYINTFGPAFIDLLARRVPLMIRKSKIDTHETQMNKAGLERERFVAMMQQMNVDGTKDQARWSAVDTQYKIANEQFETHYTKMVELRSDQMNEIIAASQRAVNFTSAITGLLPHAILSVRGELELALDEERYKQLWDDQIGSMQRTYDNAMDHLKRISSQPADTVQDQPRTAPGT